MMKSATGFILLAVLGLQAGCASLNQNVIGVATGERSLGQALIDKSIVRTAKNNMYQLDPRFKQSRINIDSFQGRVLLTGQVPDIHLKKLAEDNLKAMSDVRVVHNFISVSPQIDYQTIMQDLTTTANTRGLIMRASILKDRKVLLHTENGVLYVMGRLTDAEILDLDEILSKVGNVRKIVKLVDNIETPYRTRPNNVTPITAPTQTPNKLLQPEVKQYPIGLGNAQ